MNETSICSIPFRTHLTWRSLQAKPSPHVDVTDDDISENSYPVIHV